MRRERTFPVGACCAWLLSAAPFVLPESALLGASRAGLAALPWIAYASLPRGGRGVEEGWTEADVADGDGARASDGSRASSDVDSATARARSAAAPREPGTVAALALELAWFLPSLALGTWIDLAQGRSPTDAWIVALASIALFVAFAAAATLGASTPRARAWHGAAWFVFVAAAPLLLASLTLGGAPLFGPGPGWLAALAQVSPLTWAILSLDADAAAHWPWAALLLACVWLGVGVARRSRGGGARGSLAVSLPVLASVFVSVSSDAAAQNRAVFVDVEIHGPSSGVVLDAGPGGVTRIEGALSTGETRRISVPLPLVSESLRVEPRVRLEGAAGDLEGQGHARFVAWRGGASPILELVPGLRARSRPAVAPPSVAVSRAASFVLVAAFLSVLALRRKPAWAVLASLGACAVLFPLVRAPRRDADAVVTLYDGDAEAEAWRRVDAACDEITLPERVEAFELWTDPPSAPVTWTVSLDPLQPWRARAPGAQLFLASVFHAGGSRVSRAHNAHGSFERTWVREDGEWREHGAWAGDAPLPPVLGSGEPASGMPPGWLLGLLPQGTSFLVARESARAGTPPSWVRVGGF